MITSSNRNRYNQTVDTKEARLVAARRFIKSDRVRHRITGLVGSFVEMNYGFALPEVWVQFDSSTEIQVPTSCNPLDLERVNSESNQREKMPSSSELSEAKATPGSAVEVIEELTQEEADLRHRLEVKVERAFYEAGKALTELRDRRLYRSTHKTFEQYCRERFDMTRRKSDYLIAAAGVFENLEMRTNGSQILPTNERQIRPLTTLESPDEQWQAWEQSIDSAGGKVPSSRIVKDIVERLKEHGKPKPPMPYKGDVVEIRAGVNPVLRKHNGSWGIVTHVGSFSCTVHISVRNVDVQCKPDEMDTVDPMYTQKIQEISDRIAALARCNLDPAAWSILETLNRQTCFTQFQLDLLAWVEERYGIKTYDN